MSFRGRWFRNRARVIALLAAALLGLLGLPIASTASARPSPIQHVVVLYLENHSFDNVLGFWCDDHPGRCPLGGKPSGGGMPASVRLSNGAVVRPGVTPDLVPGVDHSVRGQQLAIDGGRMDGWWQVSGCARSGRYACISGYRPSQIPNVIALANSFAISDNTFLHRHSGRRGRREQRAQWLLHGGRGQLDRPARVGDHERSRVELDRPIHNVG